MLETNKPLRHSIPLQKAIELTARYRDNKKKILAPGIKEDTLCLSETFSREIIENILKSPGCTGLRIYYGMSENLAVHAVLVGTNAKNEDILPPEKAAVATAENANALTVATTVPPIAEDSVRCPTICPPKSPLNS